MYNRILRMMRKDKRGFTLVELMVVVVIIGILVAIAVPVYNGATANATKNANDANIRTLQGVASMYIADNGIPGSDVTGSSSSNTSFVPKYLVEWPYQPNSTTDSYTLTIEGGTGEITVAAD